MPYPIDDIFGFLSGVFPLGAGLFAWNISPRSMRLLTGLLAYNFSNDIALVAVALRSGNNMLLFHFYALVAYTLIAILFSFWHESRAARYMRLSILLFLSLYLLLLATGLENFRLPNKYTLTLMSLFVTVLALYTLLSTVWTPTVRPIYQDERFWVSLGMLTYFAGNVFVFSGIVSYITRPHWSINNVLTVIANVLYFKAYKCVRK